MISMVILILSGMSLYMLLKPETAALPKENKVLTDNFVNKPLKRMAKTND